MMCTNVVLKSLNTLERSHIYRAKQTGYLLNDIHADTYNPIFEHLTDRSGPRSRLLGSSVHVCHLWLPLRSDLEPSSLAVLHNPHSPVPVSSGYISSTKVSMCPYVQIYVGPSVLQIVYIFNS
jgi:hypothetical protein